MRLQLLEWATELVQDTQKLKLYISNTINSEKKLLNTAICEAKKDGLILDRVKVR